MQSIFSKKRLAIALSAITLSACVPDPWQGTIQFGGGLMAGLETTSSGDVITIADNGLVHRVSNAGEILWETDINSYNFVDTAIDDEDNTYISSDGYSSTLTKLNADGDIVWVRSFTCGQAYDNPVSLHSASDVVNGEIVIQGSTNCADFIGQPVDGFEAYIAKLDASSGATIWTYHLASVDNYFYDSIQSSVTLDNEGNTFAATPFYGPYGIDIQINKLDTNGNLLSHIDLTGSREDYPNGGMSIDSEGNVYLAGITDSNDLVDYAPVGRVDAFIIKFDNELNQLWGRMLGNSSEEYVSSISVDNNDNVIIAGDTSGALPSQEHAGGSDSFVAKWDKDGNSIFIHQAGTDGSEYGGQAATDNSGNIYFGATSSGQMVPDATPGLFLMKLSPDGNVKQPTTNTNN